jgi:hypothetical protein
MASWNADLTLMVYVYVVVCIFYYSLSQMRWMIRNEWTKENDDLGIKKRYLCHVSHCFQMNHTHNNKQQYNTAKISTTTTTKTNSPLKASSYRPSCIHLNPKTSASLKVVGCDDDNDAPSADDDR